MYSCIIVYVRLLYVTSRNNIRKVQKFIILVKCLHHKKIWQSSGKKVFYSTICKGNSCTKLKFSTNNVNSERCLLTALAFLLAIINKLFKLDSQLGFSSLCLTKQKYRFNVSTANKNNANREGSPPRVALIYLSH